MIDDKIHIPKCFICMDLGFILYRKQVGELSGEFVAHCSCKTGEGYNYDGQRCEKKSPYRIPPAGEVLDVEHVAMENFSEWWGLNKYKKGIEEAMCERGIPIPREGKDGRSRALAEK